MNNNASNILLWFLIFVTIIVIYAFRFELQGFKHRVLAVVIPSYAWSNKQGQLVIARNENGHFYVDAYSSSNIKIKFLVDTGASDIALTKEDAIKLGFDTEKLKYTKTYNTANGLSAAAPVLIKQLTIGEKTFYNVRASVNSGKSDVSLLGMSIIGKFKDFSISNDLLVLDY